MTIFNKKQLEFLLEDAKRELNLRKRLYPRWVEDPGRKFNQKQANYQIIAQEKIIELIEEQIRLKPNSDSITLFNRPGIIVELEDSSKGIIFNDDQSTEGGKLMKVWMIDENLNVIEDKRCVFVEPTKLNVLESVS